MTTASAPDNPTPWTDEELRASAVAYAGLLGQKRAGMPVNLAAAVAALRAGPLVARSDSSVHQRFGNIGALLRRRDMPSLDGAVRENVGTGVAERLWVSLREHPVIVEALGEPTEDDGELRLRADDLLATGSLPEPPGQQEPGATTASGQRWKRDPKVQAWVRQTAAGVCEACKQTAPFLDASGRPFLEVHHVLPLSRGGSDRTTNAAALCPNCHRRCHLAGDAAAYVELLYSGLTRLRREAPTVAAPLAQHLPD